MSGPTWKARVLSTEAIVVGQACSSMDCTFEDWYAYTVEPAHAAGRRSVLLAGYRICPETGDKDQLYSIKLERQYIPIVLVSSVTERFSHAVITACTPISK